MTTNADDSVLVRLAAVVMREEAMNTHLFGNTDPDPLLLAVSELLAAAAAEDWLDGCPVCREAVNVARTYIGEDD